MAFVIIDREMIRCSLIMKWLDMIDMSVAQVALDRDRDVIRYECGSSGSRPGP